MAAARFSAVKVIFCGRTGSGIAAHDCAHHGWDVKHQGLGLCCRGALCVDAERCSCGRTLHCSLDELSKINMKASDLLWK
jgi:hypothetical protein